MDLLIIRRRGLGFVDRLLGRRRRCQLAKTQPLRGEHVLDFDQARFAEVLALEDLRLGRASKIAEGLDPHLLEAVSAPHREFEIADGEGENMIETITLLLILIVELEVAGGGRILEEQPGPGVIGIDLEDPLVALLGVDEVVAVLVEDAEVHQRPD